MADRRGLGSAAGADEYLFHGNWFCGKSADRDGEGGQVVSEERRECLAGGLTRLPDGYATTGGGKVWEQVCVARGLPEWGGWAVTGTRRGMSVFSIFLLSITIASTVLAMFMVLSVVFRWRTVSRRATWATWAEPVWGRMSIAGGCVIC